MSVLGFPLPTSIVPSIVTRAPVPDCLESVTHIDSDGEVDPKPLGVSAADIDAIWSSIGRLYQSGIHPAIQMCVRRRGRVILNRAIGYADGGGPNDAHDRHDSHDPMAAEQRLCRVDTPFNVFSASKAVTAMLIHLLDQRGLLHLDDPVCEYIPDFGVNGKQWITLKHVLTHRAGIPNIDPDAMDLDLLDRPDDIVDLMCEASTVWRPGRYLAYHAISGGFVLGEVVKRVTGRDIRELLASEICEPLGFQWMNYGVGESDLDEVVTNYHTGPVILPPATCLLRRVLGVDFDKAPELSNDPRFLRGIIPSGNIVSTAREITAFYQMLLNGGELNGTRIFEPRTVRRAISEQSYLEFDLTLGLPLRYGMGFMLGGRWLSLYGPDTKYAFGHLGFSNIFTWADPERQISAAIMTSGKPFVYPEMLFLFDAVRRVTAACPKVARDEWRHLHPYR